MLLSDHIVVSFSIDFPSNSKRDAPFHSTAYEYSHADWSSLCDRSSDVPWEDIFKLGIYAASTEFFESELIVNIRPSLTHLHGFQLLVLVP